jgi:hypothetical protein
VFIHAKLANGRAMPAAFALLSRKVWKFLSFILLIPHPRHRTSILYPPLFWRRENSLVWFCTLRVFVCVLCLITGANYRTYLTFVGGGGRGVGHCGVESSVSV